MSARSFFLVCAGLCLLALTYHLGAQRAGAQATGRVLPVSGNGTVLTSDGDIYQKQWSDPAGPGVWYYKGRVQTTSPLVCLAGGGSTDGVEFYQVICENGDIYELREGASIFRENVFGSVPTVTRRETLGRIKDRYRK